MPRAPRKSPTRTTTGTRAAASASPTSVASITSITSISHDDAVARELRDDPALAAEYLKAALAQSDDPRAILIALRQLARAHGIARVAERARIERESLYRALSERGNPRFSTIIAVLDALGLVLTVQPAPARDGSRSHRRVRVTRIPRQSSTNRAVKPRKARAA